MSRKLSTLPAANVNMNSLFAVPLKEAVRIFGGGVRAAGRLMVAQSAGTSSPESFAALATVRNFRKECTAERRKAFIAVGLEP